MVNKNRVSPQKLPSSSSLSGTPEGADVAPPAVSSLIATLPTAAKMHRTIDTFYHQAHAAQDSRGVVMRTLSRCAYLMAFVALGLANVGDAAEIGSMGFLLAHEGFRGEILGELGGLVASSLYLGMLLGGLGAGPLCDQTGRRNVLIYGLILNSGFGVAASISNAAWQVVVCRFFMGLGIGSIVSCLLALTSEHTPPRQRGFYLNFVSAFWTMGSVYVAVMALLLFGHFDADWRLYMAVNAAPSLLSLLLVLCFVPESARFLALHGHHERATQVANRLAGSMGFRGDPLRVDEVRAHFPPSKQASTSSSSSNKTAADADKSSSNSKASTTLQRRKKRGYWASLARSCKAYRQLYNADTRGKTLGVQSLWFFVSFGSGMCLWIARVFADLPFVTHVYSMAFLFSMASVPGVLLAGVIMDKVGRTFLLTCALVGTTISLACFGCLTIFTDLSWAVLLAACIFHSCLVLSWSALSVVTAEVFPTMIRGTAMGLCAASGRFASILVHLVSAPLVDHENPSVLLFMGTASFTLGIFMSIVTQLQNKTGSPLEDADRSQVELSNPRKKNNSKTTGGDEQI